MNNKADFAPIRWSYKKTREVARRMDGVSFYLLTEYLLIILAQHSVVNSVRITLISTLRPRLRLVTSISKPRRRCCRTLLPLVSTWVPGTGKALSSCCLPWTVF
jgi:hypothetical protein